MRHSDAPSPSDRPVPLALDVLPSATPTAPSRRRGWRAGTGEALPAPQLDGPDLAGAEPEDEPAPAWAEVHVPAQPTGWPEAPPPTYGPPQQPEVLAPAAPTPQHLHQPQPEPQPQSPPLPQPEPERFEPERPQPVAVQPQPAGLVPPPVLLAASTVAAPLVAPAAPPPLHPLPPVQVLPAAPPPGPPAAWEPAPRRRRPPLWVLGLAVVLLLLTGGAGWVLLGPDADEDYLEALGAAGLTSEYASAPAAVAHGRSFCRKLENGAVPQGFKAERVATQVYCPSFLTGFTVVPTPKEQQETYLTALRDGGFGGEFASDQAAVAAAKATCNRLETGGEQQGLPVEAVALPVYCPSFADGFKVLETARIEGTFTISSSSYYYSNIYSSGGACTGTGGYSDIGAGTQLVVKDDEGATVAKASFGRGVGSSFRCTFSFSFDLLEGSSEYVVKVSRRGELSYSFTQLKEDGLELSL